MTIKRKHNLDSYTSELLSRIPHLYEPHANALKAAFANCFHRPLKGSGHLLEKVIFGYFDELLPHQIHLLIHAYDLIGFPIEVGFHDYVPISSLSDDIVQQLQMCTNFLKSNGESDNFNYKFYSYKNEYQVYGYLYFDKGTNKCTFLLCETDAFVLASNGSPDCAQHNSAIHNKEDDTGRVKLLKDFIKALRAAGVQYLDISQWLTGRTYSNNDLYTINTKEGWQPLQERFEVFRPWHYCL